MPQVESKFRAKKRRKLGNPKPHFYMATLTGLDGVAASETPAAMIRSRTAGMRALMLHGAITAAGDRGAINVWRDDAGLYRCELMRFGVAHERAEWKHLAAVDSWLQEWLPALQ